MSIDFKSRFAEDINGMIELFVSLGYAENTYIPRAKSIDSFCAEHFPESDVLTETIVRKWADPKSTSTPSVAHSRIAFARCLSDYQQVIGKNAVQIKNNCTCAGYGAESSAQNKSHVPERHILTDEELEEQRRIEDAQNEEENRKEFRRLMRCNGWEKEDEPFIDFLYEFQTKRVNDKGKSPIDDALLELLDETIYYAQPATSRNDILRKFKESVAKTSLDEDAMLILNLHVDKVIKKYSKEG